MTDSPSALLERAAAELQRRTTWNFSTSVPTSCSRCHPAPRCLCIEQPGPSDYWLATMPRDVAQPLVEWLRYAGAQYEVAERRVQLHHARGVDNWVSSSDRAALVFARTVLGES